MKSMNPHRNLVRNEGREIHPVVDRVFPLSAVQSAFSYLADGRHIGKVLIDLHLNE